MVECNKQIMIIIRAEYTNIEINELNIYLYFFRKNPSVEAHVTVVFIN